MLLSMRHIGDKEFISIKFIFIIKNFFLNTISLKYFINHQIYEYMHPLSLRVV